MRGPLGIVLAVGASVAWAGEPRLRVVEPVQSFGVVERGDAVERVFSLVNDGNAPVRLEHVKSSCGCTVAVLSARDVPPGREGRVGVTLDTTGLAGPTTKVVTVYTDDPGARTVPLTLRGEVHADLVLEPDPVYFGRVRRGERARREVAVAPGRPGGGYRVTRVTSTNPAIGARLRAVDGGGQAVVVELAPDLPPGRFDARLTLETSSPREPRLELEVFGSVEGQVLVLPSEVTLGGTAREATVVIRNRAAQPMAITGVSAPDAVTHALDVVEAGLEYRLTLRLRGDVAPGEVAGDVEIWTDRPGEGRVVVPVRAVARGTAADG